VYRRGTGRPIRIALLCALGVAVGAALPLQAGEQLKRQREGYAAALQAIERDDAETYTALRRELDDYPLAIYLDYFALVRHPEAVSPTAARRFLNASRDTPLPGRFLSTYLRQAGRDQRWRDFLQVEPDEPHSVDLKCYFFRAQLARGERETAWEGARRLWLRGRSQPEECDPLFEAWLAAGQLTDADVWTRLLNAFEERQRSLLDYVATKSSTGLRPRVETLLAVYRDPGSLARQTLPPGEPWSRDVVTYGLAYLASYSPAQALAYWRDYRERMPFDQEQVNRVERAIARQGLFARTRDNDEWLAGVLARLDDDELVGIRLRWALSEEDWGALARFLPLLTPAGQEKTEWRYWRAVLEEREGDADASKAILGPLAGERDYHGFLAADRLGLPYAFNHLRPDRRATSTAASRPAIARIEELNYHDQAALAQAEWYELLVHTPDRVGLEDLMLLASGKGWYRMAIDAASQAQDWDALDYRFPTAHEQVFRRYAADQGVSGTELMAIARRESAFYPGAESPVGARGLMQLKPDTGRLVAASLREPFTSSQLFEVEHNVKLGSAYYRQLLDRFDGNRVFALTAYNAGPNRVDRWRHEPGEGIPVELWIDTIPYRETRNYVQAVLAYNVVFQYLLGDTQQLLSPLERRAEY
jgi:soluble lytic murein transglycosylase